MITDTILNILFFIPCSLLAAMDTSNISLSIPSNVYSVLDDLCSCVGYVLPVVALLPIFTVRIGLKLIQVTMAIVVRIKSFIPAMGA